MSYNNNNFKNDKEKNTKKGETLFAGAGLLLVIFTIVVFFAGINAGRIQLSGTYKGGEPRQSIKIGSWKSRNHILEAKRDDLHDSLESAKDELHDTWDIAERSLHDTWNYTENNMHNVWETLSDNFHTGWEALSDEFHYIFGK